MQRLTITISGSRNYYSLTDAPDGVTVETLRPSLPKSFGPIDQITVNIDIDLAKIAATAFAAWLVQKVGSKLISIARKNNPNIDCASKNDADTIEAITRTIEDDKYSDGDG